MSQTSHKRVVDENDISSSLQESEIIDELIESSSSHKKKNPLGKSSHKHYQSDLMKLSIPKLALNNSVGSGDDDFVFGRKMPKTLHWSIPWSDLMMTMFILFAVMYVYQSSVKEVPSQDHLSAQIDPVVDVDKTLPDQEQDSIRKIYDMSREALNMDKLTSISSIDLVPNKAVRIILTGDLLFDLGKAELKEEAKVSLQEIAKLIGQTPYMVNVVGHTDDLPINTEQFPSNWELSTARATQVARFLIKEKDIPADKFFISGHASYQPLKPNNGEMERAVNRRVEIIITKERPHAVYEG